MSEPTPDDRLLVLACEHGMTKSLLAILTEYGIETDKPFSLHIGPVEGAAKVFEVLVPDTPVEHSRETQEKMMEGGAQVVLVTTAGDAIRACTHRLDKDPHRHALLQALWEMGVVDWDDLPEKFRTAFQDLEMRKRDQAGVSTH